jgi:hypothetical protein
VRKTSRCTCLVEVHQNSVDTVEARPCHHPDQAAGVREATTRTEQPWKCPGD